MVKLGFIAEGATEKIVLERSDFFSYLDKLNIAYVPEVIDAQGNGNLLPHKIEAYTKVLVDKGATHIFILTDLDEDVCITKTKERISPQENHIIIVSVKAIEAWFLADTEAMGRYLKDTAFVCNDPEAVINPFGEIRTLRIQKTGQGFTDKRVLANTLVHRCQFSIQRAAQHNACGSARYFLEQIALFEATS